MKRLFYFKLFNNRKDKTVILKQKGETRGVALGYLIERLKNPQNYIVLDVSSVGF